MLWSCWFVGLCLSVCRPSDYFESKERISMTLFSAVCLGPSVRFLGMIQFTIQEPDYDPYPIRMARFRLKLLARMCLGPRTIH